MMGRSVNNQLGQSLTAQAAEKGEIVVTLAETFDEVVANIGRFNEDVILGTDIVSQLSQFRHWYYLPELDLFGPCKFIGYKNMNTSKYQRGYYGDGRETKAGLRKWFQMLERGDKWRKLATKLEDVIQEYGKRPNRSLAIWVPKVC